MKLTDSQKRIYDVLNRTNLTDRDKAILISQLQEKLVSGENISTINGEDITKGGNIEIQTSSDIVFKGNYNEKTNPAATIQDVKDEISNDENIITKNDVVNNLESDNIEVPLSAAQGKILNEKIQNSGSGVYYTNMLLGIDFSSSNLTDDDINQYIGSWDGLVGAIQSNTPIFDKVKLKGQSGSQYNIIPVVAGMTSEDTINLSIFVGVDKTYRQIIIVKTADNKYTLASAKKVILDNDNNADLLTDNKTIIGAINEVDTNLESAVKPYVINLTDLLAAQNSESISTAIGGIDNLNGTIQKNQVIFGTLANGTVAVGIRVLGNQTTLTYFVDSVVGLTVNEVIITNTSGTLTKTANTHAVLTENMVVNSLKSDETTLPLSAAQGKVLASKITSGKVYVIDGSIINEGNPTSEQISEAIGGWDNLSNAIRNNNIILLQQVQSGVSQLDVAVVAMVSDSDTTIQLSFMVGAALVLLFTKELDAISLRKSLSAFITSQDITSAINALDSFGQTASTSEVISSVSQKNGVISVSKKTLTSDDIPELPQSKITNLETALAGKQDTLTAGTGIEITPENQINVTLDTTVFKVVSVLPDSPAAGDENKIHLVPAESTEEGNIYTEYVFVNGKWEEFGTYRSEVDLTTYLKKEDAETTYQKITDNTLATKAKTVTGAINEIKSSVDVNSDKQYLHKVYEEYGAVYNNDTGYWEYGDLKDMTEEDCFLAAFYALEQIQGESETSFILDRYNNTQARTYFTKIAPKGAQNDTRFVLDSCFAQNSKLEYLKLSKTPTSPSLYIKDMENAFRNCRKLRKIEDILTIYASSSSNLKYAFMKCSALKDVKIRLIINVNLSFEDSPLLSYESIKYLVDNARNTAAITITVHPTTYGYLTGTTPPTAEVGGTTEEWQALVTTAQGKQISFA